MLLAHHKRFFFYILIISLFFFGCQADQNEKINKASALRIKSVDLLENIENFEFVEDYLAKIEPKLDFFKARDLPFGTGTLLEPPLLVEHEGLWQIDLQEEQKPCLVQTCKGSNSIFIDGITAGSNFEFSAEIFFPDTLQYYPPLSTYFDLVYAGLLFGVKDLEQYYGLTLRPARRNPYSPGKVEFRQFLGDLPKVEEEFPAEFAWNKWLSVKLVGNQNRLTCILDGQIIFTKDFSETDFSGGFGLISYQAPIKFRNLYIKCADSNSTENVAVAPQAIKEYTALKDASQKTAKIISLDELNNLSRILERFHNWDEKYQKIIENSSAGKHLLKAEVSQTRKDALFCPAPSKVRISLPEIPAQAALEISFGVLNQAWQKPGDGVVFEISISEDKNGETAKILYSEYLNPKKNFDQQKWFEFKISLQDYIGKKPYLQLSTFPSPKLEPPFQEVPDDQYDFAVWGNPRLLYPAQKDSKKNIILVSVDTLRTDHLSCYGYHRDTTPNIDALAKHGVIFDQCITTSPWTTPAHMSIMTAYYPSVHGLTAPLQDESRRLAPECQTLAEILSKEGYTTAAFTGDAAVGGLFGFQDGFSNYCEFDGSTSDIQKVVEGSSEWLKNHYQEPFFIFVHTYEPHFPYVNKYYLDKNPNLSPKEQKIALYDGDIHFADEHLSKFFKTLEDLNLDQNTLLIFLSDHGEDIEDRIGIGIWGDHGHTLFEELLKVPLILVFPKYSYPNLRLNQQVSLIDIMPTILDFLGLPLDANLEGSSLLPLVKNQAGNERPVFSEATCYGPDLISYRLKPVKFIYNPRPEVFFRGVQQPVLPVKQLYDLSQDPQETRNLYWQQQDLSDKIMLELDQFLQKGRGGYYLRFNGNGQRHDFSGKIVCDGEIARLNRFQLEFNDTLTLSPDKKEITFRMLTGAEEDGFQFTPQPPEAKVEISLELDGKALPNQDLFLGKGRSYLDQETIFPLENLHLLPEAVIKYSEAPSYPIGKKLGCFIWVIPYGKVIESGQQMDLPADVESRLKALGYIQ